MPLNAWKDQHCSVLINPTEREKVAKHVSFKQELSKVYTDKKRHAKPTQVIVGDNVRTKRPVKHDKLEPTWSEKTFKVIAIKGGTLTLDNGQRWNVAKCLLCPRLESDTFYAEYEEYEQEPDAAADVQVNNDMEANLAPVPHRRSTRVTRPPDRYSPSKY